MQTFTFVNQKGGVGKSTLAVHFALWHAREKLFIDMGTGRRTQRAC